MSEGHNELGIQNIDIKLTERTVKVRSTSIIIVYLLSVYTMSLRGKLAN